MLQPLPFSCHWLFLFLFFIWKTLCLRAFRAFYWFFKKKVKKGVMRAFFSVSYHYHMIRYDIKASLRLVVGKYKKEIMQRIWNWNFCHLPFCLSFCLSLFLSYFFNFFKKIFQTNQKSEYQLVLVYPLILKLESEPKLSPCSGCSLCFVIWSHACEKVWFLPCRVEVNDSW